MRASNKINDIFFLILNISQLKKEEDILRIFINSINNFWKGVEFNFSLTPSSPDNFEIVLSDTVYGYINYTKHTESLDSGDLELIHNACRMVGVFLQKLKNDGELNKQRIELEKSLEQTSQDLLQSENYLELLAENMIDLVTIHNIDGTILYNSPSIETILDYRPTELLGTEYCELIHIDDKQRFKNSLNSKVLAGQPVNNIIYRIQKKNNGYIWFNSKTQPIFNKKGEVVKYQSLSRNVTDSRNNAWENQKIQTRLLRAEHIARFGNWEFDLTNNTVETSLGARNIYGLSNRKHSISRIQKIPLIQYRKILDHALNALIEGNRPYDVKFKIKRLTDGKIRDIHSIAEYNKERNIVFGVLHDITEQIKTEQKFLKSEEKYKSLYNNVPVALFRSTIDGVILNLNQAMVKMYGFQNTEELLNTPASNFYENPNDRETMLALLKEKKEVFGFVTKEKKKDGSIIWVESDYKAHTDSQGNIIYFDGVAFDITNSKNASEKLQKSEERFRQLSQTIPSIISIINLKTKKYLFVNNAWHKLFGYSEDELNEIEYLDIIHPDMRDKIIKQSEMLINGIKTAPRKNLKCITKNNKTIWLDLSTVLFPTDGENVIIAIGNDITTNLNISQQLKESETKYRQLIEKLPDAIIIFVDNKIRYTNKAALTLLNAKTPEEFYGHDIIDVVYPPDIEKVLNLFDSINKKDKIAFPVEFEFIQSDEKNIFIEVFAELTKFEGKEAIQVLVRDITNIKEANKLKEKYYSELELTVTERTRKYEENAIRLKDSQNALTYLLEDVNEARVKIEGANKNLEELNKELESFTYSVSHDLRAPLRAIDGFSKIVLEEYKDKLDEEGIRLLSIIVSSTTSMKRLIEDLLAFSRLGRINVSYFKINTNEMIRNIMEENNIAFNTGNIIWDIKKIPNIAGDRTMIKQVFVNLMSNAVKFTKTIKQPKITIEGKNLKNRVEISISDNGIGFSMKYANKIFEVFQRLHSGDKFEGTGIGLAIVKKVIDKHHGTIKAVGDTNNGATFIFTLPLK